MTGPIFAIAFLAGSLMTLLVEPIDHPPKHWNYRPCNLVLQACIVT